MKTNVLSAEEILKGELVTELLNLPQEIIEADESRNWIILKVKTNVLSAEEILKVGANNRVIKFTPRNYRS